MPRWPASDENAHSGTRLHEGPNPPAQIQPCMVRVNHGSNRNGYDTSASIDPRFDSANRRYTELFGIERWNQACVSGPVDESRR